MLLVLRITPILPDSKAPFGIHSSSSPVYSTTENSHLTVLPELLRNLISSWALFPVCRPPAPQSAQPCACGARASAAEPSTVHEGGGRVGPLSSDTYGDCSMLLFVTINTVYSYCIPLTYEVLTLPCSILTTTLGGRDHSPCITNEETEAQGGNRTCLRLHHGSVVKWRFELRGI